MNTKLIESAWFKNLGRGPGRGGPATRWGSADPLAAAQSQVDDIRAAEKWAGGGQGLSTDACVGAPVRTPVEFSLVLVAKEVEVRAGARLLLTPVSFQVAPGDKVGLVGRNGAGKTTLTKILAGEALPAAGQITRQG